MSIYLRNIIRFGLLLLLQVLLLNHIPLLWWSGPGFPPYTPFIYPLFLLLLPFSTPKWFLLISGFAIGICMDAFMDTGGMHAAACVFLAFSRTKILTILLPKRLSEYKNTAPNIRSMGWSAFLTYCAMLLLLHNAIFYMIEIWSFSSMGYLLLKVILSLVTSMVFVVLYALLFSKSINTNYYEV
jgi:hypothetical protein